MPEMEIRKAARKDLPLIEDLLRANGLPYEDVPSKVDSFLIGCIGTETIGIGGVEIFGRQGLLRSLVVKEEFRGKGLGKALCRLLEGHAASNGVEELYLLTTTAAGFFRKLGFSKIERGSAPEAIKSSDEFARLCPATAICMSKRIGRKEEGRGRSAGHSGSAR